jgi:hypothetical protein
MSFEDDLREALRRREPPAGFAERVLARVERPAARRRTTYRVAGWAAAAALVIGCGLEYRQYREARRAREETMLALRIAGRELLAAQKKLAKLSFPLRRAPEAENR